MGPARGARASDEIGARVEVRVRVGFDQIGLVVRGKPEVEPGVVAEVERLEARERGGLQLRHHFRGEVLRDQVLAPPVRARPFLPFDLGPGDARRPFRKVGEVELHRRERRGAGVAEHPDVDLPPLDVLLDQHRVIEVRVELVDPLHQLLDALHQGAEADADRSVLADRLDDHRKVDVVRPLQPPVKHRDESGRQDAVEVQDLLRLRLVHGEKEAAGTRPGIPQSQELVVGGHVRLLRVVIPEGLHQVEEEVGL